MIAVGKKWYWCKGTIWLFVNFTVKEPDWEKKKKKVKFLSQ